MDILLGKSTDKIRRFGHDRLSTFGIGTELDQSSWRSVYRQLVARGYVNVDHDSHGALKLNERCRSLLKGDERVQLRRDRYEPSRKYEKEYREVGRVVVEAHDQRFWEALRQWRRTHAEEQNVPAYVILNDKTLMELVKIRPQSHLELSRITGIGQFKLEKYGDDLLKMLGVTLNVTEKC